MLSTLRYFRQEYEEHVYEHKCRAHACSAISTYVIDAVACKGCGVCKKRCPAEAIEGVLKEPYVIDVDACVKCGICETHCPFDAIHKV